jgi:DNA invertase Pin-like site-specific DNA recombinase
MNVEKLFIEKASGKDRRRPQLKAMMDFVQAGDTVVVHELSRMARSVVDLYDIAKELNDKGVSLESLKEDIDLTSATGKLTFGIMAVMAQFERDLLLERQKEGIAAAKARGKRWGRENIYGTDERLVHEVFSKYYAKKISFDEASKKLEMKKSTFYYRYNKWIKEQVEAGILKEEDR